MCGRYTLTVLQQQLADEFELYELEAFEPRYNIAPTQEAPIVRVAEHHKNRELVIHKWGLIPHWAKDPSIGNRMINARAETAAEKPAFRTALRRQRCLVPCSGFYEWKALDEASGRGQGSKKQPYYIRRGDERIFAFAGLWDRWRSPDGEEIGSFTILTTEPNELMRDLHNRMPVIIAREYYALWLDGATQDPAQLAPLLRPCPADELVAYPVSTRVNNPKFEDPSCIQAVE
jgi:putative SOS response-associated peptidase YedK